jgi:hypothetical protein
MAAVNGNTTDTTMGTTAMRARVSVRHAVACAPTVASHKPSMAMTPGVSHPTPMGHVWTNAIADAKNLQGFGYGARRSEEHST